MATDHLHDAVDDEEENGEGEEYREAGQEPDEEADGGVAEVFEVGFEVCLYAAPEAALFRGGEDGGFADIDRDRGVVDLVIVATEVGLEAVELVADLRQALFDGDDGVDGFGFRHELEEAVILGLEGFLPRFGVVVLEGDVLGVFVLPGEVRFTFGEAQEGIDLWLRDTQGEVGVAVAVGIGVAAQVAGLDVTAECGRFALDVLHEGIEIGGLEGEVDVSDELTGVRNRRGIDLPIGTGAVCAGISAFLQRSDAVHRHICGTVGDGLFRCGFFSIYATAGGSHGLAHIRAFAGTGTAGSEAGYQQEAGGGERQQAHAVFLHVLPWHLGGIDFLFHDPLLSLRYSSSFDKVTVLKDPSLYAPIDQNDVL